MQGKWSCILYYDLPDLLYYTSKDDWHRKQINHKTDQSMKTDQSVRLFGQMSRLVMANKLYL